MTSLWQYLIWSNEHRAWWRADHNGYTSFIEEAGRYTEDAASSIVKQATVDGRLGVYRADPVTGRENLVQSEVKLLAPESWELITTGAGELAATLSRATGIDLGVEG